MPQELVAKLDPNPDNLAEVRVGHRTYEFVEERREDSEIRVVVDRRIRVFDYQIPKRAIPGLILALQWYEENKANIPLYDPNPDSE